MQMRRYSAKSSMKKILSFVLAATMLFSMASVVFADDSKTTLIKYGVNDVYEVSIPPEINLDINGQGEAIIEVGGTFLIPYKSALEVYISGSDYTDRWELVDVKDSTNKLGYRMSTSSNADIKNNDLLLKVNSGTDVSVSSATETIEFNVYDKLSKSGNYSDVLTFTVIINNNPVSLIEFNINAQGNRPIVNGVEVEVTGTYTAEEGMTLREWCESDYNTVGFTIGHIGDKDILQIGWAYIVDNYINLYSADTVIEPGITYYLD